MRELVGSPRDLLHVLSAAEGARYLRCRVATCGDCNATGAESASGKHHSGRPDDVDRCTWRSACGVGEGFLHLVTSADWRASGLAPASVQLFAATLAPRSSIVSPLRALPQALGLNPVKRTGPLLLDSALPTTAPPFQPSAPKLCQPLHLHSNLLHPSSASIPTLQPVHLSPPRALTPPTPTRARSVCRLRPDANAHLPAARQEACPPLPTSRLRHSAALPEQPSPRPPSHARRRQLRRGRRDGTLARRG